MIDAAQSVCSKLYGDYIAMMTPIAAIRGKAQDIDSKLRDMKRLAQNTLYAPANELELGINQVNSAIDAVLPDPRLMTDIQNIITQCTYFPVGDHIIGQAMAVVSSVESFALDTMYNAADALSDQIPEFNIAAGLDAVATSLMNSAGAALAGLMPGGTGDIMKKIDKIMACIESICPVMANTVLEDMIAASQETFDTCMMNDDPESPDYATFDVEKFCDYAELPPDKRESTIAAYNMFKGGKTTVSTRMAECRTALINTYVPGLPDDTTSQGETIVIQGPQGEQGAQGAQGVPGVQGPQGVPGTSGTSGSQGPQGVPGSSGSSSSGLCYYLDDSSSDITGYLQMLMKADTATSETYTSISVNQSEGDKLIKSFITGEGNPNQTILSNGEWLFNTYCHVNNTTGNTKIKVKVYKRNTSNVETLLFDATTSEINDITPTLKSISSTKEDFLLDDTDRLVVKYYAFTTSVSNITVAIYYNGDTNYSHIHTPILISGISGSGLTWEVINSDTTAIINRGYLIDASGGNIILTLSGSPYIGDTIGACDYMSKATTNIITINRNGKKIEGLDEDLVIDVDGSTAIFVYTGTTIGWKIY